MFSRVRIAIRFFFVGLAVGVLLAPRSGEETRKMLREKADSLLNGILDAATLGTAETGTATAGRSTSASAGQVEEEAKAPRTSRSSNGGSGSGRSRGSRSTTSAEASTGSVT
jgi:YtxH-like protein